MKLLPQILFDSYLRMDNFKTALEYGLFGKSESEILKNVERFTERAKLIIDAECQEINAIVQGGVHG